MASRFWWLGLVGLVAGCAPSLRLPPPGAEARSLLGDTLWTVPVGVAEGRWRVQRLNAAREDAARRPGNFQPALDVAGHTAGLGRLRQAYELYGEAMLLEPLDPRPRLRRGELLLQLRELMAAREELVVAERLARTRPRAELEPLPDGSVQVRSIVLLSVNEPGGWSLPDNARPADETEALYWYAQGLLLLWSGQAESASRLFRAVLRLPDWTRPAVTGAEKELERLSGQPLLPDRLGFANREQVAVPHQRLHQ